MTETTEATPKASTGFGTLRCPLCSCEESQQVDLDDLSTLTCRGCGDEYNLDNVREMVEQAQQWAKVLAWIDSAPIG